MSDNSLSHYGLKGMKWGVRRAVGSDGRVKTREGDSEDYVVSRQRKATPNRQLSSKELKALNERLQLEKTNKDLTYAGSVRKIRAGTNAAGAILAIGTTAAAAYQIAQGPVGQAIKAAIKAAMKK